MIKELYVFLKNDFTQFSLKFQTERVDKIVKLRCAEDRQDNCALLYTFNNIKATQSFGKFSEALGRFVLR